MWEFINNSAIAPIVNNQPILVSLIQHYALVVSVLSFLLIIVMYSFRRSDNNE